MEKIKTLAKVGIGLAIVDFIFRGFGPLYTTERANAIDAGHFIWVGVIPAIVILTSIGLIKGKKWGLYTGFVLILIAIVAVYGGVTSGEPNILSILYLIVYGLLVFFSLQESKNLQ